MIICFQQLLRLEKRSLLGTAFALYKVIINPGGEIESYRPPTRSIRKETKSMKRFLEFLRDERGASAVEYGLLVALIAAVIVGAVTLLGGNLQQTFTYVASVVLKP